MPLVAMTSLFERAHRGSYAVGYFEAWDTYSLEAVIEAAEAENAPVIVGFGCMMASREWLDAGGIEVLAGSGRPMLERIQVPAAFLLNEAHTLEQAKRGIDAGFNAVMVDTSAWPWEEALETTIELVSYAHAHGASVEAELGRLPDAVEGGIDDSSAKLTDPDEAAEFVQRTGVDCLAVSVGNIHLLTTAYAPVDLLHLEAIYRRVQIPLVMHGGTSFPPHAVQQAIAHGVAKFNVGTILKKNFFEGVRAAVSVWPERVNTHDVLGSHKETDVLNIGKARMRDKVRELIHLYGGSGQAW